MPDRWAGNVRRLAAALSAALLMLSRPAAAQEIGLIRGVVFVDINGNALRDSGEAGFFGAEVVVANGVSSWRVTTGADGSFTLDVPLGTWQVALLVPVGYQAGNSTNREVTLAAGTSLEAALDFALVAPATPVPAQDGQPPTPTLPVPTATQLPPPVLPQTGVAQPVAVLLALALAGLLAGGLLLVAFSRWVLSRS
jgi:LPXTG-motif cell wall-anchored protein